MVRNAIYLGVIAQSATDGIKTLDSADVLLDAEQKDIKKRNPQIENKNDAKSPDRSGKKPTDNLETSIWNCAHPLVQL